MRGHRRNPHVEELMKVLMLTFLEWLIPSGRKGRHGGRRRA